MYQNCCKKCGSIALHTEKKGSQVGLYCDECGAWQKWCSKDEQRAIEHSKSTELTMDQIKDKHSDLLGRLGRFVQFLDNAIDKEFEKLPLSPEDAIRKSSYCLALERDKNAIISIMNGKEFDYVE